jgi:hypothetical protein
MSHTIFTAGSYQVFPDTDFQLNMFEGRTQPELRKAIWFACRRNGGTNDAAAMFATRCKFSLPIESQMINISPATVLMSRHVYYYGNVPANSA